MKVLMVSAECHPFAKVGGLADVVGALPKALEKLNIQVEILLPFYRKVQHGTWKFVSHPEVPFVKMETPFAGIYPVMRTTFPGTSIPVTFIGHPDYFDREGIYDNPATGEAYPDQALRWIFFSQAAVAYVKALKHSPHILHLHDNHVGLVPAYLRNERLAIRTVFHIHNLAYQGNYDFKYFPYLRLPADWTRAAAPLEFWGYLNFMKCGIVFSDRVVTVSPTYAKEVTTDPEFGMGMEGVLGSRGAAFGGIINGIDTEEWNPAADPLLPFHYSAAEPANKAKVKDSLLEAFGLPKVSGDVPLLGMVTRLADQKGLDLVAEAFPEMIKRGVQMVILGTGQLKYHEIFTQFQKKYPHACGLKLAFDNRVAHLIEGGADLFLMPSHFEPCGLNQMYSLRYGTVPLVRRTGGLADTVEKVGPDGRTGTGFVFDGKSAQEMLGELKRALAFFKDRTVWKGIVRRGMEADFSWDASAKEYKDLYGAIL
jgi:starch synthase